MKQLAANWSPPEAYPAVLEEGENGWTLHFPDLQTSVSVPRLLRMEAGHVLMEGARSVRGVLRRRRLNGQLFPFASNPESVGGRVVLISTEGWDKVEEEDAPE